MIDQFERHCERSEAICSVFRTDCFVVPPLNDVSSFIQSKNG